MALRGSDNSHYYQLKTNLSNNMTKGMDNFPKTMVDTMRLISDYTVPPRLQHVQPSGNAGVAFVQGESGAKKPAGAATPTAEVVCWHCAQTGHYKSDCLLLKEIDQQHGVQNFSIKECDKGHNLFVMDDGWTLIQKGKKGVQGILSHTTCSSTHVQATQVLRTRLPGEPQAPRAWPHGA
jgi:hypothetical protein